MNNTSSKAKIIIIVIVSIVVIGMAIAMPIILRNVEIDKRTEDVNIASDIAQTIIESATSGVGDIVVGTPVYATPDTVPDMQEQPFSKGNTVGYDEPFIYYYVKQGGSCAVYVGDDRTYNLNNEIQAQKYINK